MEASEAEAYARVVAKGEEIRQLKAQGLSKADLQPHIDQLLALKAEYTHISGKPYVPRTTQTSEGNEKKEADEAKRPTFWGDNAIEFRAYHSINNHTDKTTRKMLEDPTVVNAEWIALEKVHGANFCLTTAGTTVVPARRTANLRPGENFFNFEAVTETYADRVKAFFAALSRHTEYGQLLEVRMFGELYGGFYPKHPTPPGNKAPNRDIFYCPHNDWVVFDARATWHNGQKEHRKWLNHDQLVELCNAVQLPVVPILHRGTLAELLQLDPLFLTTIPALFHPHLPAVEDNFAEGFILKTLDACHFEGERAIIKFKNSRFLELHNAGYKQRPEPRPPKEVSPEVAALRAAIRPYITRERLVNVCSKLTVDEAAIPGRLRAQLIADAVDSYLKAEHDSDFKLETSVRKQVIRGLENAATNVVTEYIAEQAEHGATVS